MQRNCYLWLFMQNIYNLWRAVTCKPQAVANASTPPTMQLSSSSPGNNATRALVCTENNEPKFMCNVNCDHAMEQQQQQEQEEMIAYWNNAILGLSMKIDATFQRIMFTKRLYPFCAMDETMFVQFLSLLLSFSFPVLLSFEYCLFSIWASFLCCELLHWLCGERLHSIK